MSDTIYSVECGFFDAVNEDRVYTAAQMNMPYRDMLTEGIFNTDGTAWEVVPGEGMSVQVKDGIALLGGKWAHNTQQTLAVPDANSIYPRIDSVILQVNNNVEVRAGRLVYRTGTPAASPVMPDLDTSTGVFEIRLAKVSVAEGATSIAAADISDRRGLYSDCPLVKININEGDIQDALEEVLTDHPEWVTTVEDGAVTTAKLANGAVTLPKLANGVIDNTLTVSGAAADAAATGGAFSLKILADASDLNDVKATGNYY